MKAAVVVTAHQRELATPSSQVLDQVEKRWSLSSQRVQPVHLVVPLNLVVLVVLVVQKIQELLTRLVEYLFRDRKWFKESAVLQERQ